MQSQPTRTRAVLAGATVLLLSAALAACGSEGGRPSTDAKAAGASGGASASAAQSSSAPPKPSKVLMPTGPAADLRKVRDTAAGPIMMTTVTGAKSGVTGKVWVWLPPEYNDPKYAKHGFPVLTLYAGGQSAGYNTWTDNQLPIQEADAQLSKQGKAHPFIMIMRCRTWTPTSPGPWSAATSPASPGSAPGCPRTSPTSSGPTSVR